MESMTFIFVPVQLAKETLDSPDSIPYPPMIKLVIERSWWFTTSSVPVEIVGIKEKGKKFILNPKPTEKGGILSFFSSLFFSAAVTPIQSDLAALHASHLPGPVVGPRPTMKELLDNVHTLEWYHLGCQLTGNVHKLDLIRKDHIGDASTALQKMFSLVLREDPDLSWPKVVDALEAVREFTVAKTIKDKFCQ